MTDADSDRSVLDRLSALDRRPRVMITKIGLDGHDRGSRLVAGFLRDAGMEVIYTAPWQDVGSVVALAMEEDIDLIGVSSLATDHLLGPQLMEGLETAGLGDIPVVFGGIIPDQDTATLKQSGVAAVFHPGASHDEIVETIAELVLRRRAGE